MEKNIKIAVIGGGNMGGAIAEGVLRHGVMQAGEITVSDPSVEVRHKFSRLGIRTTDDNSSAISGSDIIIVAVKPWLVETVLTQISPLLDRKRQSVASVAAGIDFATMEKHLLRQSNDAVSLYRIVPNTAISIGKSVTFISGHRTIPRHDKALEDIFNYLGSVNSVTEGQLSAVTALCSSGIAYALKYIDAAVKGASLMGLDSKPALDYVVQTIEGACQLLKAGGLSPQQEIDRVTTPGGITLKGLEAMDKNGFSQAVIEGLLSTK